ncbi:DHH family phosphoesterase [Nanoarchaeota archaeon]
MLDYIKQAASQFKQIQGNVRILTHHDTGGITSAAIISKAIQKEDRTFKISVIKQLDRQIINSLKEEHNDIIFFLDFGSASLDKIKELDSKIFIFDNHELSGEVPENITLINPHMFDAGELNASVISYLFAKELNQANSYLSYLAVLGMVGDYGDLSNLGMLSREVIKEADDVSTKRNLRLFPATRPIHKALEFSSKIYIPGITGSLDGALKLLKEAKIPLKEGIEYRTLLDLTKDETERLLEALSRKTVDIDAIKETFGHIYLIKFFGHLEDARELSMLINACGKMGHGDLAISFCMGSKQAKFFAENIYIKYKHLLLDALKWIGAKDKIEGKGYVIINAGHEIKDTIIGTVLSILSASFTYAPGTALIGMSNTDSDRIKVSARVTGKQKGKINLQQLIEPIAKSLGGEGGGHHVAAGCLIPSEKEQEFITMLQKDLDMRNMEIKVN